MSLFLDCHIDLSVKTFHKINNNFSADLKTATENLAKCIMKMVLWIQEANVEPS